MQQEVEGGSKPPSVWDSLLAHPGWTALLIVGTFLAAVVNVVSDDRLGVHQGIGLVLAYTGMSVALKLLVLLGVRVWTSGRFVMHEMRHVAAILGILIASVAVATPAMLTIWTKEQLEKAGRNTGTSYVFTSLVTVWSEPLN